MSMLHSQPQAQPLLHSPVQQQRRQRNCVASLFYGTVSGTQRVLLAAAWPIRGIWYCLVHRELHPLFISRLLPLSAISFLVYCLLFTFTFLPQFAFLAIFHGWGAWFNTVMLVLGEGLIVIQCLFEGFFIDECRVDVFDAILINEGYTDLVASNRILYADALNSVKMLGKPTSSAVYQPWSLIQMVELVVFLPLNLVPIVGPPLFIMITGTRLGKLSHYRWFKLRGLTSKEKRAETRSRLWEYVWFGTVAMIAELIPVLSFFLLLTTTAGSALWAAEMERQRARRAGLVVVPSRRRDFNPENSELVV